MQYPIYDGEQEVGKALVKTEGMTYRIEVICNPLSGMPERIAVKNSSWSRTLGTCIPDGPDMKLIKRLSKREMPGADWRFEVLHLQQPESEIKVETGVESIAALRDAHLEIEGENYNIVYDISSSKPTGQ